MVKTLFSLFHFHITTPATEKPLGISSAVKMCFCKVSSGKRSRSRDFRAWSRAVAAWCTETCKDTASHVSGRKRVCSGLFGLSGTRPLPMDLSAQRLCCPQLCSGGLGLPSCPRMGCRMDRWINK